MTHAAIAANEGRRQAFQRRVLAWLLLQMSLVVVVVVELGVDGTNANTGRFGSRSLRNVFGFIFCFVWLVVCVPVFFAAVV